MPLRLRRGTNAERQTITPAQGELIYVTDTKRIWVGDGTTLGGVDIVAAGGGSLQGSITLNNYNIEGLGNIDISGFISNGTLTLDGNRIISSDSFIASGSGNTIGVLELGNSSNFLQVKREWGEPVEPMDLQYGITNGFFSLVTNKNVSRGTIDSPTIVLPGDALSYERTYGYDGFDYVASSGIWQGVDPSETPSAGYVPGAIAFTTIGAGGQNVISFDSHGYFGINKFPNPANEALDVVGNGIFTGSVTAAAFKGSFFGDDSTLLVDGISGTLSNGTLTLNGNKIFSNDSFVSIPDGNTIGTIELGSISSPVQLSRYWKDLYEPFEKTFGLSGGWSSLQHSKYASRGTLNSPTALIPSDCISVNVNYGHDGSDYQVSSLIWQGVDPEGTVSSGVVPGKILFITRGVSGLNASSGINSLGYLGVLTGDDPIEEALDVRGNVKLAGKIVLNQNIAGDVTEEYYGITAGPWALQSTRYSSRGTIASPLTLQAGDSISTQVNYGHDGTNYQLSSLIWCGSDVNSSITTGAVPGAIAFITAGTSGLNDSSVFDSNGYLGILVGTDAPAEALDVRGNAKVNGKVVISQTVVGDTAEEMFGVTIGYTCLSTSKSASRGTVASPVVLQNNDCIAIQSNFGYDGSAYVLSSAIWCGVDASAPISTGNVPGQIRFSTASASGFNLTSGFDANGYFGIRNDTTPATEALDVHGNAVVRGEVNASAFKGTFVADDSTIIVDGLNGNVTGNTVTSNGFVMFGSYDATGRSNLTAANGMVIYNTTANRFQGFQNGAWINLDDGTAAP
jgi:hypothetical protein